jgi:hypothetical protein
VKLVPAVRADTTIGPCVAIVVLHVTPSAVPRLSSGVIVIRLMFPTAVVCTTSVGSVPVGTAPIPATADPHTDGDAPLTQAGPDFGCIPVNFVIADS